VVRSLPFIVDLVLTVVAIVDISLIDNSRVRGLPKWAWVLISIFLFVVGPLLWFFVGRERLEPRNHGRYPDATSGGPTSTAPRAPRAPDDDPEFLGRLSREQQQAQRIRDLERELDERRGGEPTSGDTAPDDPKQNG
jgi:hypothetical protein